MRCHVWYNLGMIMFCLNCGYIKWITAERSEAVFVSIEYRTIRTKWAWIGE